MTYTLWPTHFSNMHTHPLFLNIPYTTTSLDLSTINYFSIDLRLDLEFKRNLNYILLPTKKTRLKNLFNSTYKHLGTVAKFWWILKRLIFKQSLIYTWLTFKKDRFNEKLYFLIQIKQHFFKRYYLEIHDSLNNLV